VQWKRGSESEELSDALQLQNLHNIDIAVISSAGATFETHSPYSDQGVYNDLLPMGQEHLTIDALDASYTMQAGSLHNDQITFNPRHWSVHDKDT